MGLAQGCAVAGALLLAVGAWLIAAESHLFWPYLLFGAVFVILCAHIMRLVVDGSPAFPAALLSGIPLAIAAYWLGATPYRWLEYACWAFAAAYLVLVPRMRRAVLRIRRASSAESQATGAKGAFDLRDIAIALAIVISVSGLILCVAIASEKWSLYAGAAAILLWPATLVAVPWYAGIAEGDWLPLAVVYGGGAAALLLYRGGTAHTGNPEDIPNNETGPHRQARR